MKRTHVSAMAFVLAACEEQVARETTIVREVRINPNQYLREEFTGKFNTHTPLHSPPSEELIPLWSFCHSRLVSQDMEQLRSPFIVV